MLIGGREVSQEVVVVTHVDSEGQFIESFQIITFFLTKVTSWLQVASAQKVVGQSCICLGHFFSLF
jgi:hypothetical protein